MTNSRHPNHRAVESLPPELRRADLDLVDRFLAAYESLTGRTYNPFWEIASELEHEPSGVPPSGS